MARLARFLLVFGLLGLVVVPAAAEATAPYTRLHPPLTTPWTDGVSATLPLPDYPRPQMQRAEWLNLNGQWQYQAAATGQRPPFHTALAQTILVPYPVQSALSGIGRGDPAGWYRRMFEVPAAWRGQHVLLNFGAVSWQASVYVNGRLAGRHLGDYDAFSFDITKLLHQGANELVVGFQNPVGGAGEPVGKQIPGAPFSFYHTASSGIWQTVWLEPVAAAHVTGLNLTPDVAHQRLLVDAALTGAGRRAEIVASATAGGHTVASVRARAGAVLHVPLADPHLWSPEDPYLYGLTVSVQIHGHTVDRLKSYFGMRTISLGRVSGVTRVLINGRFLFQSGALDQGMWPDGLYAAPTDSALRANIVFAQRLGFNMLREHAKVQPDRFYFWADRLGMLVWQDMPNMALRSKQARFPRAQAEFRRELTAMVTQRRDHPSIVTWVPFNEGWVAFDPAGITAQILRLDPTRLIDTDSGSANTGDTPESSASDFRDTHLYFGPFSVPPDRRASVIGEYGGALPIPPAGHIYPATPTSVGGPVANWPVNVISAVVRAQYENVEQEMRTGGLSASVFTELFATEQELGVVSYDRRLTLLSPTMLRRLNRAVIGASQHLTPPASVRTGHGHASAPAPPSGATASWDFDEGQGGVAQDSARRLPLTLEHGAAWTRGVHGRALSFPAAGAAALAARPLVDTQHSFTVGAWLASDRRGQTASAVSEPGSDGSAFSLGLVTAASPSPARTWWAFQTPGYANCPPVACPVQADMHYGDGRYAPGPGRWHYVAGVYNEPAQTITVYVDGLAQDVEHAGPLPAASGPLEVGAGQLNPAAPDTFIGAVDELRIYPRALSPADVWQLYQASRSA